MWAEIYEIASSVSTPLALASTTVLLAFLLFRQVLVSLAEPIKRITGTQAFVLILSVMTYGTVLASLALAGGLGMFAYGKLYERFVTKEELIRSGLIAIDNQEGGNAIRIGQALVAGWPEEPDGYKISAIGRYLQGQHDLAVEGFLLAVERLPKDPCHRSTRNMYANAVASYGMMGAVHPALEIYGFLDRCELEKGMRFNQAKLLAMIGKLEESEQVLRSHQLLNRDPRPDYRDRSHFLLGVLKLQQDTAESKALAQDSFVTAACLDSDFQKLFKSSVAAAEVDPPGTLVQDFSYEIEVLRRDRFASFVESTSRRFDDEC